MIPSLLQIPSAVSDSKLHSVLPNNGKGDFTFDRSTGATRINKDGLIEEVGYFSSELVQNGDFSELGSELVTNGDFASNINNWAAKDCTIVWDNGKLKCDNSSGNSNGGARQNIGLQNSTTYKLVATIQILSAGSNGTFNLFTSTAAGTGQSSVYTGSTLVAGGDAITETAYFTTGTDGDVSIQFSVGVGNAIYTIDNVSVKQVDPNDRWNLDTDWSYGNNKVTFDYISSTRKIYQDNLSLDSSKNYKLKFTIQDIVSGTPNIWIGNSGGTQQMVNYTDYPAGSYSLIVSPPSDSTTLAFWCRYADFSITNISLVEVQGDRPRLSYDITNGVVESQPHLLLEPSSTNLVTFSEDFSKWTVDGEASISSDSIISPEGIQNSDKLIAGTTSDRQAIKFSVSKTGNLAFSIFAKKGGYSVIQLSDARDGSAFANFNLDTGAVGNSSVYTASIVDMGNDWYRCKITWNASFDIFAVRVGIVTTATSARVEQFAGNGTDGLYIYGAQLEQQTRCTSYIPTAGTTITRAAETSYIHNIDDGVLNQSGFTLFLDTNIINNTASNFKDLIALYNTAASTNLRLEQRTDSKVYIQQVGVVSSGDNFNSASFGSNSVNFKKFAVSCSTSEVQLWADGNKINDYSGSYVYAFDKIGFRFNDGTVETILKHKGVAIYNEALTDAQLTELTS